MKLFSKVTLSILVLLLTHENQKCKIDKSDLNNCTFCSIDRSAVLSHARNFDVRIVKICSCYLFEAV